MLGALLRLRHLLLKFLNYYDSVSDSVLIVRYDYILK